MSGAARCPVCEGRTTVPAGFYTPGLGASNTGRETCRSCGGTGIVLSEAAPGRGAGEGAGDDPMDLEYRRD